MGKYFGTDGVRGVANQELTPELAFKLGRYGGYVLAHNKGEKHPRVLVGRDTRVSGEMLESALIAGLISIGAEVMRLGIISTPGVAYLTRDMGAELGVMISASHNPVADNGIKFFGSDGFKLSDEQENEIEALLDQENPELLRPVGNDIVHYSDYFEGAQKYLSYLKSTVDVNFEGLKIVLDGANGSTSSLAPFLFGDLEADTETIGCSPDGYNINEKCGSTHPEKLAEKVVETESDFGLAFDGDGDRIIAVDENGQIVDGDQIMFIIGQEMHKNQELNNDMIVSTVMSNLGFYKALEQEGIKSNKTKVGDRYVVEEMRRGNYNLGGEQSGHIVMMDYNTTGDGLLTGIQLASVIKMTGKSLSELAGQMKKYPQSLINVRVTDKYRVEENVDVKEVMTKVEVEMNGEGRILVRPSGTEPLVRVMVEAATDEDAERFAQQIADVVQDKMGLDK
ncbi:TPA: phosphoglucosamine mutase [Staphylococcus aureus]|uniref:Phosphoglucosamine mutase n=1 Tax=Staphylococcus aureus TaxID=1280 RepID=A0A9N8IK96_STAAU|nr:Phosphoglucosamine mutase / FemD, factor involved in methicillin resistance [Staphylococcus aureus]HDW7791786.1 phosphoglucosamine mutase [Staphylococcus aureus]HDW7931530.1 phosphoglucosamine mutase [Staphylococcus aureus]HDW7950676.1 phosphoglucosamine mutase [Staphylococcus aureus]